nr:protein lifeguard 2-like [Penaeus vannamei]
METMEDTETVDITFVFSEKSVRMGFIRKVYTILCTQLLVTFGIIAIFVGVPAVSDYTYNNLWMLWVAIGLSFALIICFCCSGNLRRKTPWNYIALSVFTICEGFLLGVASAHYQGKEVAIAVATTAAVTLVLTLYACQVRGWRDSDGDLVGNCRAKLCPLALT